MRIALSLFIALFALFSTSVEARPRYKGYHQQQGYGYYGLRVRQIMAKHRSQ